MRRVLEAEALAGGRLEARQPQPPGLLRGTQPYLPSRGLASSFRGRGSEEGSPTRSQAPLVLPPRPPSCPRLSPSAQSHLPGRRFHPGAERQTGGPSSRSAGKGRPGRSCRGQNVCPFRVCGDRPVSVSTWGGFPTGTFSCFLDTLPCSGIGAHSGVVHKALCSVLDPNRMFNGCSAPLRPCVPPRDPGVTCSVETCTLPALLVSLSSLAKQIRTQTRCRRALGTRQNTQPLEITVPEIN